jgi:hypothetical protein
VSRLALVVLGLWLGMLIASWVAASVNFRTVDRVLGPDVRPEVTQKLAPLAPEDRRMVLRHLASEINRWIFQRWAAAQLVLGLVAVGLLWSMPGAARWLALAALVLVVMQIVTVRPIVDLGRSIDFLPRPLPPDVGRRFGLLHAAYVFSDLAKALVLAATLWTLARR